MDQQANEDKVKQVIVIRKDLNMRKGKIAAQASHASMKVFFDRMHKYDIRCPENSQLYFTEFTPDMESWFNGIFTKITVYVESEEDLLKLKSDAEFAKLPVALITDCGLTEFNGVPTNTCIAIGPAKSSLIDPITKSLPLL